MAQSYYTRVFAELSPGMATRIIAELQTAEKEDWIEGAFWYEEAHALAKVMALEYSYPLRTVVGVVAALSPRMSWNKNVAAARSILLGSGSAKALGASVKKAIRIRDGEDPLVVLGGKKVTAFFHSILDPYSCDHVVVDQHAGRVALGTDRADLDEEVLGRLIERFYDAIADAYREAGKALYLHPMAAQSISWCKVRRERLHGIR